MSHVVKLYMLKTIGSVYKKNKQTNKHSTIESLGTPNSALASSILLRVLALVPILCKMSSLLRLNLRLSLRLRLSVIRLRKR